MKYILKLTLTLLLITAIVAGLLGLVNSLTEDKIAEKIIQGEEIERNEMFFPVVNRLEYPINNLFPYGQYNRDDYPGVVEKGKFKFFGRDLIFELDDVFSKQDLRFAIDKCLMHVKKEHPHSKIYL